jgi:hypothetical protein
MRPACSAIEPAVITLKLDKLKKLEWFVRQTSDQNYRIRACMSKLRELCATLGPSERSFPARSCCYRQSDCCQHFLRPGGYPPLNTPTSSEPRSPSRHRLPA